MFQPTDPNLFFTKNDATDIRLGDWVKTNLNLLNSQENNFAILGYPDDEGIRLNGGRPGAALAPHEIRRFFYKMTPPFNSLQKKLQIFDVGNCPELNSLNERHNLSLKMTTDLYEKNLKVISLGGGHDYGYVDGHSFCEKNILPGFPKPLIINFDAHLDVRPNSTTNHSGTPFYRLKEKFKSNFNLIEIGLQSQCNSKNHWDWALSQDIALFSLELVEESHWKAIWDHKYITELTQKTPVFISFDIDGLQAADAGGCSQAWPTGLKISECLSFLKTLYSISNPRGLGIYEVAPNYDYDFKTSKAAALLMHQFLFS